MLLALIFIASLLLQMPLYASDSKKAPVTSQEELDIARMRLLIAARAKDGVSSIKNPQRFKKVVGVLGNGLTKPFVVAADDGELAVVKQEILPDNTPQQHLFPSRLMRYYYEYVAREVAPIFGVRVPLVKIIGANQHNGIKRVPGRPATIHSFLYTAKTAAEAGDTLISGSEDGMLGCMILALVQPAYRPMIFMDMFTGCWDRHGNNAMVVEAELQSEAKNPYAIDNGLMMHHGYTLLSAGTILQTAEMIKADCLELSPAAKFLATSPQSLALIIEAIHSFENGFEKINAPFIQRIADKIERKAQDSQFDKQQFIMHMNGQLEQARILHSALQRLHGEIAAYYKRHDIKPEELTKVQLIRSRM